MGSLLCQKTKNMFGCEVPINASVAAYKYFFDALEEADKLKEEQGLSTYEKVFESLGMAIHYVQDMCCLVHQVTWSDNLVSAVRGFHTEYENNVIILEIFPKKLQNINVKVTNFLL